MAKFTIDRDRLRLVLTPAEKLAGLHRDITVPLAAVRAVSVEADALAAVRGLRAPGLALPGLKKIGTWRGLTGKRFVVARRGQPAVRIVLDGTPYEELVVGTADAEGDARRLREHAATAA